MKFITKFRTNADYEAAKTAGTISYPNISLISDEENKVIYSKGVVVKSASKIITNKLK